MDGVKSCSFVSNFALGIQTDVGTALTTQSSSLLHLEARHYRYQSNRYDSY